MNRHLLVVMMFASGFLVLALTGCGREIKVPPSAAESADGHAHPSAGPHGGSLVELGNEEYHAELVHGDAAGTVTVYVLDSAAKASVAIDAPEMSINLTHDGRGEQFKLAASAAPGDSQGNASRFVSTDAELAEDLDQEEAAAELVVNIHGKQYRGAIQHGHDHAGGHHHEGDDTLVWQRQDIQHAGYVISIGHHSKVLHAGEPVEPAVSISRDGQPVSDAQVFNSLWSGDGKTALAEEMRTVYEPPTDEEPAHYAQGGLKIPSDAKNVVIRYRIVLPANAPEVSYDVAVGTEPGHESGADDQGHSHE